MTRRRTLTHTLLLIAIVGLAAVAPADDTVDRGNDDGRTDAIRIASLTYAGDKPTLCFNDAFLTVADRFSTVEVDRRLYDIRADSESLFVHPLVVMAGNGAFELTDAEVNNLRDYLQQGGILIATSKCDDTQWDASFRSALSAVLASHELKPLPADHALLHTLIDIDRVTTVKPTETPLWCVEIDGRIAVLYSSAGLTDSAGQPPECCCCGANEITNARQVLANAVVYAVTH